MPNARYIGTYRDIKGTIHKKFKDDENYVFININSQPITIQGDGETKSPEEVYKEIEEARALKLDPIQRMSNAEFKRYMRGY